MTTATATEAADLCLCGCCVAVCGFCLVATFGASPKKARTTSDLDLPLLLLFLPMLWEINLKLMLAVGVLRLRLRLPLLSRLLNAIRYFLLFLFYCVVVVRDPT